MSLGPIVVLAVLLLVGVDGCLHCAGWHPPSVEEEMLSADQIVYGRVTRTTFPDDRDQYRAEVQVYCVMKGQRTPVFISLTDVGPDQYGCGYGTSLIVGHKYIIMASSSGRSDVFKAHITYELDWNELPNYTRACALSNMYPSGVSEEAAFWTCPTPAPPGECLDRDDFPPQCQPNIITALPVYPVIEIEPAN